MYQKMDDDQLLGAARCHDMAAIGELYQRYKAFAVGIAFRFLHNPSDIDDVVAEAFVAILTMLADGRGPEGHFRNYLATCVRRISFKRNLASERVRLFSDSQQVVEMVVDTDFLIARYDTELMRTSFAQLPQNWQHVIIQLDVEGKSTKEVASELGLALNAVSALVMRARSGLLARYIQNQVGEITKSGCRPFASKLGDYLARNLSRPVRERVSGHLDGCSLCSSILYELRKSVPHQGGTSTNRFSSLAHRE